MVTAASSGARCCRSAAEQMLTRSPCSCSAPAHSPSKRGATRASSGMLWLSSGRAYGGDAEGFSKGVIGDLVALVNKVGEAPAMAYWEEAFLAFRDTVRMTALNE